MAELVKIKVVVSGGAQAAGELENIKKLSDQLRQPINVKINASGLKAVDKETLKTAKAFSDLAKQIYKLEVQHTKQAKEAEKTAQVEAKAAGEVAKAYAKAAQEEAKAATQREKNAGITERQVLEDKRLATQQERTATAQANLTREQVKGENQMKRMEGAASKLNIALGNIAAYAISRVVSELRRAVGEALNTMRDVDTQLVTIRKVTGFSGAQIDAIREQAYSTASAYGVGASDYLESVAAFSRAGYKEQSAALAELSTKTQIVGDTTAETANQFLLAVDAAYKYKGSIADLTRVLDGANEIDNKYATSIEKIAEGMGIVAPVAAQMHVGVNELAAALGTITAVTQRSGSEAARALRAIMLNIVGDTKTEIEDGVTWTQDQIDDLRDVLRRYAPEAYAAAQATGSIINPMEAIAGLSKSIKDGLVTEADLMAMVSDIGDKRRSSQLLALIQNWDMYQSMLVDYGNAIGSADKEVANALDSWERKTIQLQNTWAEFVSKIVETDAIKGALDDIIAILEILNSSKTLETVNTVLSDTAWLLDKIGVGTAAARQNLEMFFEGDYFEKMFAVWERLGPGSMMLSKAGQEIIGIGEDARQTTAALKDAISKVEQAQQLQAAIDGLADGSSKLSDIYEKATEIEQRYRSNMTTIAASINRLKEYQRMLGEVREEGELTAESAAKELELSDQIIKLEGRIKSLTEENRVLVHVMGEAAPLVSEYAKIVRDAADATEDAATAANPAAANTNKLAAELRTSIGVYNDVSGRLSTVAAALKELDEEGVISFDTMGRLIEQYPALAEAAELTANGYVIERSALEDLIAAKRASYEITYKNAVSAAREQISALEGESKAWLMTADGIKEYLRTKAAALRAQAADQETYAGSRGTNLATRRAVSAISNSSATAYEAALNEILASETALSNFDTAFEALRNSLGGSGRKSSGGSSSTAKAERDAQLDYLKEVVSLREGELSLMQARGDSEEEQIAKMREIQAALHEQANYLRSIGASQTDINALSTKWWQIQNNILSLQEKIAKQLREEIADSLKDAVGLIEKARDDALKPLNEELDKLKAAKDAVSDRRKEEEKLFAVEKARIALENAQNERNVRQYNAATGQWEWVANAQTVQDAAQTLADANANLAEYYADREYKAAVDALEKQVDYTKSAFDEFKSAWEEAVQAVRDGKMSFEEAYAYIEQKMREIYNDYGIDLTDLLHTINGEYDGIAKEAAKIRALNKMQANSIAWHMTEDAATKQALHDENRRLGESIGLTFDSASGSWLDSSGNAAYTLNNLGGTWTSQLNSVFAGIAEKLGALEEISGKQGDIGNAQSLADAATIAQMNANSEAWHSASPSERERLAAENLQLGMARGWTRGSDGVWRDASGNRVYDTGGILYGTGAIKATNSAEMVLPPAMTQSLLEAEKTGAFNELLNHLGIITAAANSYAGVGDGTMRDNIGSQHNGDVYHIGGVTLSEQQARGMTIYDLAQMGRNLALANS